MDLLLKLFCKHTWKTHAKKTYQWIDVNYANIYRPETVSETVEILICEKCGKIRKIEY